MTEAGAQLSRRIPQRVRAQAARFRILLGIGLSLVFLAVTLSGIDLQLVARIILEASPVGLAAALALVGIELSVRAYRWRLLLSGIATVTYRKALGFLCIGYFANSLLPARLGDLARAYLAGAAFRAPRLATLGTILVERVTDGLTMVATVLVASVFVPRAGAIRDTAVVLVIVGLAGLAVLAVGYFAVRRADLDTTRIALRLRDLLDRVLIGAVTLRTWRGAAGLVLTTLAGLALSILGVHTVAGAVGLQLGIEQAALVSSGLALSLAIPAAPGSLGTYEFVGVSILVGLGFPAEASLATIVVVHVLVTLPAALAGMVAMWAYHLRVGTIVESAEPAELPAT